MSPDAQSSRRCPLKIPPWRTLFWWILWGTLFTYSAIHLWFIQRSAFDIPWIDEWDLFIPGQISSGWSKDFIFSFWMDHRKVVQKILYLLNYDLFRLNFRYQIFFNLLLYVGLLITVWKTVGQKIGKERYFWAFLAFLPLVSTLPAEVHTWALLGDMTIALWSFIGGTYLVFHHKSWTGFIFGVFLWLVSLFNYSGSLLAISASCLVFSIWNLRHSKEGLIKSLILIVVVSLNIYGWSLGYQRPAIHPEFTMPWHLGFYKFWVELVSLGFGFREMDSFLAYLCFYLVVLALFSSLYLALRNHQRDSQSGFLIASTLGLLGMLALIAVGRAGFPLWYSKLSRYSEISIFLPIFAMALLSLHPVSFRWGRFWVVILLGLGLYDQFGFSDYRLIQKSRNERQNCVRSWIEKSEVFNSSGCPNLFPFDLKDRVPTAESLEVNFTKVKDGEK